MTTKLTTIEHRITDALEIACLTPWARPNAKKEAIKAIKEAETEFLRGNEASAPGALSYAADLAAQNADLVSDTGHREAMLNLYKICETLANQIERPATWGAWLRAA